MKAFPRVGGAVTWLVGGTAPVGSPSRIGNGLNMITFSVSEGYSDSNLEEDLEVRRDGRQGEQRGQLAQPNCPLITGPSVTSKKADMGGLALGGSSWLYQSVIGAGSGSCVIL